MRALVVLGLCAACNSLLGLDKTQEFPPDAPPLPFPCNPFPEFATPKIAIPGCTDYSSDADDTVRVVATCSGTISEGAPGSTALTPVAFDKPGTHDAARLFPAGDQMAVRVVESPNLAHPVGFYVVQPDGAGTWTEQYEITFSDLRTDLSITDMVSTPSAANVHRRIILMHSSTASGAHDFREYAAGDDPTMPWDLKNVYDAADFGQVDIGDPYLSPDGLALVFVSGFNTGLPHLAYMVREDVRESFVRPTNFESWNLMMENAPFLTRDCKSLFLTTKNETALATPN
jgi:hypothetical protein